MDINDKIVHIFRTLNDVHNNTRTPPANPIKIAIVLRIVNLSRKNTAAKISAKMELSWFNMDAIEVLV